MDKLELNIIKNTFNRYYTAWSLGMYWNAYASIKGENAEPVYRTKEYKNKLQAILYLAVDMGLDVDSWTHQAAQLAIAKLQRYSAFECSIDVLRRNNVKLGVSFLDEFIESY